MTCAKGPMADDSNTVLYSGHGLDACQRANEKYYQRQKSQLTLRQQPSKPELPKQFAAFSSAQNRSHSTAVWACINPCLLKSVWKLHGGLPSIWEISSDGEGDQPLTQLLQRNLQNGRAKTGKGQELSKAEWLSTGKVRQQVQPVARSRKTPMG